MRTLYQWYGDQIDRAESHADFLRFQASRRLLRYLFSGALEDSTVARYQPKQGGGQDYMSRDAFDEETQQ